MNTNDQIDHNVQIEAGDPPEKLMARYAGVDNDGQPKETWLKALQAKDDKAFVKEAETSIWLSAYANNNPRSDYHWQASACYDEAKRRGKPELYTKAYNQARATAGC